MPAVHTLEEIAAASAEELRNASPQDVKLSAGRSMLSSPG